MIFYGPRRIETFLWFELEGSYYALNFRGTVSAAFDRIPQYISAGKFRVLDPSEVHEWLEMYGLKISNIGNNYDLL